METRHLHSTLAEQICSLTRLPVFLKIVETVIKRGIPRVGVAVAHEFLNIRNWVSEIIHKFCHGTPTRLSDYRPGSGYLSRQALFTHELLHALGLDHVENHPRSILNEKISQSIGTIGPGDIAGMAALGELACK